MVVFQKTQNIYHKMLEHVGTSIYYLFFPMPQSKNKKLPKVKCFYYVAPQKKSLDKFF